MGLAYEWQILIISSVVLLLVVLVVYVWKKHGETRREPATRSSEQFGPQSPKTDDPEHCGYDQQPFYVNLSFHQSFV